MSRIDNWKPSPEGMRRFKDESYVFNYTEEWAQESATNLTSRARVRKIISDIQRIIPKGSSTLDVGCGGGSLVTALASSGYDATGYDSSPACLKYAESHGLGTYIDKLPIGRQFDFVSAIHVLEHVDNPGEFLQNIYTLLKHEGIFYAIVPNLSTVNGILGEQFQMLVFDTDHRIAWEVKGLKKCFEEAGFTIKSIKQRVYFGILASIVASKIYRSVFGDRQEKGYEKQSTQTKKSISTKTFRLVDYVIPPKTVTGEKEHRLFDEIVIEARK